MKRTGRKINMGGSDGLFFKKHGYSTIRYAPRGDVINLHLSIRFISWRINDMKDSLCIDLKKLRGEKS